ncbi:MAG TPA: DUF2752 domain-containing protein [Myxococcaceae bacterium]|nr:DUF2752 domain-containing protein [Myxococcaceae bacterium]
MTFDWTPRERRFTLLHALGLAGVMGLLVARFVPVAQLPFWRCALREHTGWPCPGCGLTRAAEGLAHLRLGFAFESNPLGALVGCLLTGAAVLGLVQWVFRLPLPVPRLSATEARAGRSLVVAAALANYAFVIVQTRLGWR